MNIQLLGECHVEAESQPVQRFRPEPDRKFLTIVKRKIEKQPIARSVVGVQQQVADAWDNIPCAPSRYYFFILITQ